jgi:hypothetical protein
MQHRNGKYFGIACAIAVLCPSLALGAPQTPPSAPVTVVNTAANPVPITGSTTVSGSVAATQSGTWAVQVVNPATTPIQTTSVDKDGRIPYQMMRGGSSCANDNHCAIFFPPVPANHRLVVRHLSGFMVFGFPSGSISAPGFLVTLAYGADSSHGSTGFIAPTIPHVNLTTFDQAVLFYVDGGNGPVVFLDAFAASFGPTTDITLIGELVDCTVSACAAIAQ